MILLNITKIYIIKNTPLNHLSYYNVCVALELEDIIYPHTLSYNVNVSKTIASLISSKNYFS